jgi:hypothetical protein
MAGYEFKTWALGDQNMKVIDGTFIGGNEG